MSELPNAGEAETLATGGSGTTLDVVVGVVGVVTMELDGEEEATVEDAAEVEATGAGALTVIDGTDTAVEPGAAEAPAVVVAGAGVLLPAALEALLLFDVHAVTSNVSPTTTATGARRRAENIKKTCLTDQNPKGRAQHLD